MRTLSTRAAALTVDATTTGPLVVAYIGCRHRINGLSSPLLSSPLASSSSSSSTGAPTPPPHQQQVPSPSCSSGLWSSPSSTAAKALLRTSLSTAAALSSSFHTLRGSFCCSCPPSSLAASRCCRSFHFYLNLEDPADTQRYVEEELEKLTQEKRLNTAAHLHSLLNLSLSCFLAEDFIKAREFAEAAHTRALAHNNKSSFLFLSAKTCARSCAALADQYEAHLARVTEASQASPVTLAPKPSVVFSAQRAIRKLRADAARYEGIATRVYNKPENAFMRSWGNDGEASGGGGGGKGSNKHRQQQHHSGDGRPRDVRCAFSEDGGDLDMEWERLHGERWQQQRRRPEHAELRRHQQGVANRGNWTVPK